MENDEPKQKNAAEKRQRDQLRMQKILNKRIIKLAQEMEKFNIAEYLNLLNNPRRYLKVNFLVGMARGVGFALGATIFAALVIYFLQRLVVLNLPLIGDFIADLIRIVQDHL